MSKQNPFMRSTNDCYSNGCKNGCNKPICCDNKDKNPCVFCPPGPQGPAGEIGPAGPQGPSGLPGGVLGYADFYALMPPENSATVAPGTDVSFPENGPIANTNIGRLGPSSFNLGPIGSYPCRWNSPCVCASCNNADWIAVRQSNSHSNNTPENSGVIFTTQGRREKFMKYLTFAQSFS